MKKIETDSHYEYQKLFDAAIDNEKLRSETVGRDARGNLILHISETYNIGNAYSTSDCYYIISKNELSDYLKKARDNKLLTFLAYRKLLKQFSVAANEIGSFESVILSESGMRFSCEYEIVMSGENAQVSEYQYYYSDGDKKKRLQKRAVCSEEKILKLLNDCNVLSWNGFNGPHPRGVLDGIMFSFKAVVNSGTTVTAAGSQNFPKGYREFTGGLYEILKESE